MKYEKIKRIIFKVKCSENLYGCKFFNEKLDIKIKLCSKLESQAQILIRKYVFYKIYLIIFWKQDGNTSEL